jgi:glyoxylase-like metal-dependent hydrolase (beta-lactamase superfamily II)
VARQPVRDLSEGVWQFQAPLWQTNSLLAVRGNEALLCDPALLPNEIEAIRSEAAQRSHEVRCLLVTHADFDHVCGIPFFPEPEIVCGEETAEAIRTGAADEGLRSAGIEWGAAWPGALRVNRVVAGGAEHALGAFRVAAIDAPSHGREGLGYVLLDQGVLAPGDHLSAITYPLVGGPLARAKGATARLLEALDRHDLRWVVPGHGPALSPAEARTIGEADLAYLDRLAVVADEAVKRELAPGPALLHVYAVEPPRPTTPDFEVYEVRTGNARQALVEAQDRSGSAP